MGSVVVVAALVVGALVVGVAALMVLENWSRLRVPVPSARARRTFDEPLSVEVVVEVADAEGADAEIAVPAVEQQLGRDELVPLPPVQLLHVIEGRGRADQLVATLFAAYAASRGSEANRAAAWVTSIGWPPEVAGGEFRPGADLRGRPAAVTRLLRCDAEGRSWVTLNAGVDIGRGLRSRPPTSATLAGVAAIWAGTRSAMSELPASDLRSMIDAITVLESQWRGTPMAAEVLSLLVALTAAADDTTSVRLQITNAPIGPPTVRPSRPDSTIAPEIAPAIAPTGA